MRTLRDDYSNRPSSTPRMGTYLFVAAVIIVLVVLGGWWYREWSINRDDEIQRDRFNFQQTQQDEIVDLHQDLLKIDVQILTADPDVKQGLQAQRKAIADQLCDMAARVNDPSVSVETIIKGEC